MTIIQMQGFTKEQYAEIKKAAKQELDFRVSFLYHKQKYCYGSIDIKPLRITWDVTKTLAVWDFIMRHNLGGKHIARQLGFPRENIPYVYANGFNYLMQQVGKGIKNDTLK